MKKLVLVLLGLFVATAQAEETKYTLNMSGITWGACKAYVREALENTFKANNILITSTDKARYQKVTFTADNKTITREEAAEAMEDKKNTFMVWSIRKAKEEKEKGSLDVLDKKLKEKCQWHLLFLKNHTPFTQVWKVWNKKCREIKRNLAVTIIRKKGTQL